MAIQMLIHMVTPKNMRVPTIPHGDPVKPLKVDRLDKRSITARGLASIGTILQLNLKKYFQNK
jgi:hypothetical protein